jgi:hypothetical protein
MADDALRALLEALAAEGVATRTELRERLGGLDESAVRRRAERHGYVMARPGAAEAVSGSRFEAPEDELMLTERGRAFLSRGAP